MNTTAWGSYRSVMYSLHILHRSLMYKTGSLMNDSLTNLHRCDICFDARNALFPSAWPNFTHNRSCQQTVMNTSTSADTRDVND